ncbi:sodium-hydrogen antiporter [Trichosporon asahii var. asahii CBS 8904]|uniref:Sodium-hydrogen antiporter n=1 Tax=Trichosporon asahii var. asahii (strain CBS 8904) TaxID=1220162 RepID=K1V032_TRIAC|nr:sodium-hydrogen antiporter [Trichosporon asahii var. asahii CBS 8904]
MWSFQYHEPSTTAALILVSFLYLLNVFGWFAQVLLSCGLLGQIFLGIIYGTPLAGLLPQSLEESLVGIGYVGLLLIIFEGGMQSSLMHLKATLGLSVAVALTGILAPMALSFTLMPMSGAPALHAFAAGSSLASTSLGTVLGVLAPSVLGFDLRRTMLGATLLSAAIMDDVAAFVISKVLQVIGAGAGGAELGRNIGRTLGVTLGIAFAAAVLARWVLKPAYLWLLARPTLWRGKSWGGTHLLIAINAALFTGAVAVAGYAGTSLLYGVYVSGLCIAYMCDSNVPADMGTGLPLAESHAPRLGHPTSESATTNETSTMAVEEEASELSLIDAFDATVPPVLNTLLLPIFFGSIGYSIPFIPLWRGTIIWKGIIYAVLMTAGKMVCGAWIFALHGQKAWRAAVFLGMAMVARGEIGLLISQIALHTPDPLLSDDEFLIVTWGIILCTIVGPLAVGVLVKRWGKLVLAGGLD